jgi:hypothetical protein
MVHEMYFNTPDRPRRFPFMAVWVPQDTTSESQVLVYSGDSPYQGNPFLKLDMFPIISSPWAQGLVDQGVEMQDVMNIVWTQIIQHVIHESNMPIELERGAFEPKELAEYTRNRLRGFVLREPNAGPAQRLAPAPLGQGTTVAASQLQSMMRNQMYVEDPVFGITSKRGESGRAFQGKLGEATSVIQDVAESVADRLPAWLRTFVDTTAVHLRPDHLLNLLQGEFSDDQLANFLGRERGLKQISASIRTSDVVRRTPAEVKADLVADVGAMILTPEQARREYFHITGKGLDTEEGLALEYARRETFRILNDESTEPRRHENHGVHVLVHRSLLNSPQRDRYSPESLDELENHIDLHIGMQAEMSMPPEVEPPPDAENDLTTPEAALPPTAPQPAVA